ncbi:hypothetical protein [Pedobacter endophyticus]|uniref:Uncharacterized protein n=1 Tax=Pedobacter endophyticus TaxID=2789740 RepID=A0A7S9KZ06_9SPHI|nr:hypothetical protein [Pedobacter endophyticus]QPH39445.1 hypothetical protein IZT61_20775 [Pedobacter endophyticus]
MELVNIYERINFVRKFKEISLRHNDFKNSLNGNNIEMFNRVLSKFEYQIKYFKKEEFYKIEEKLNNIVFIYQFSLKNGIVEPMLYVKNRGIYIGPDHRFDSICEKLDNSFSRKEFPIPVYTSEDELTEILSELFLLYEDFKVGFLKSPLSNIQNS